MAAKRCLPFLISEEAAGGRREGILAVVISMYGGVSTELLLIWFWYVVVSLLDCQDLIPVVPPRFHTHGKQ